MQLQPLHQLQPQQTVQQGVHWPVRKGDRGLAIPMSPQGAQAHQEQAHAHGTRLLTGVHRALTQQAGPMRLRAPLRTLGLAAGRRLCRRCAQGLHARCLLRECLLQSLLRSFAASQLQRAGKQRAASNQFCAAPRSRIEFAELARTLHALRALHATIVPHTRLCTSTSHSMPAAMT